MARVLHVEANSDGITITLGIGTTALPALDKSWRGQILTKTGNPLMGGNLVITSVGKTQTFAKSTATVDQLSANPQVRLSPPSSP